MTIAAGVSALEALERGREGEWTRLFERCPWATPFQHPGWQLAWCHAFGGEIWTATIRRNDELAGILPVFVERRAEGRVAIPVGAAVSDYLDAVAVDARSAEDVLAALAEGPFDRLDLPRTRRASPLLHFGRADREIEAVPCPVIPLPAHVNDLGQVVSPSLLSNLRKARRRAERERGLTLATYRTPRDAERGMPLLAALHEARWRERGERGVLADPHVQRFHFEAAPALAHAGLLRLHELRLGGETAAVLYAFHHRSRAYLYLGGFDPAHDRLSTGSLVMLHALEQAVAERLAVFDMLTGRESYKYRWGAVDEPVLARSFALRPRDVLWGADPWDSPPPAPSTARSRG